MTNAIDRFTSEVLAECGVAPEPLIDVEAVAHRLGVRSIDAEVLIEDGRLEVFEGEARILVRRDLPEVRRRFTIAHELGHLLLLDPSGQGIARRVRTRTDDVERLCDEIAASMLLPRDWLAERFSRRARNLSTVRHVGHLSGSSLSAATARLSEVLGWSHALLRWRRDGGRWRFVAGAGLPSWVYGHIRSAPGTSSALDAIAGRTSRDVYAKVPMLLFDQVGILGVQVSVSGSSAVALLDLRNAQSQLVRARNPASTPAPIRSDLSDSQKAHTNSFG